MTYPCCVHRHPRLAQPITEHAFCTALRNALIDVVPKRRRLGVGYTFLPELDATHRHNPRRYAQYDLDRREFQFATAVLWLPVANRRGIIRHEIGHLLLENDDGHTEADADAAASLAFGRPIAYDHRWPGKGLQSA